MIILVLSSSFLFIFIMICMSSMIVLDGSNADGQLKNKTLCRGLPVVRKLLNICVT